MSRYLYLVYQRISEALLRFDRGPGGLLWRLAIIFGMAASMIWIHTR